MQDKEPVYYTADTDGVVFKTSNDQKLGVGVTIISEGFRHRYWHGVLGSLKVQPGDKVTGGQLLMLADNTGMSTGTHLHYDLALVDAQDNALDYNNGYLGCVDPTPYYVPIFIKDYITSLHQQISILQSMVALWQKIKDLLLNKK